MSSSQDRQLPATEQKLQQARKDGQAARYTYRNAGADLLVLFNLLRLRTPLEGGVRVTYRGAVGQWLVEPLAFSLRL